MVSVRCGTRSLRSRAEWFLEARPVDYAIAASSLLSGIPLVGKGLRPVSSVVAIGVWGSRLVPEVPELVSWMLGGRRGAADPTGTESPQVAPAPAHAVAAMALCGIVSPERLAVQWPAPQRHPPVLSAVQQRRRYLYRSSVRYGSAPEQVLDVWRRRDLPPGPAPVLVFVPGGAWVYGSRRFQGHALLSHLAEQGWVCLAIDYRVAPQHRWPRHLIDVKTAVAWARENAHLFGGDRDFVAIAGASAGGHLAALTGLTADDDTPGAELPAGANTSVDAVVGIYARYDWEDRSTREREEFVDFLEHVVVRQRFASHPEVYRAASPIARVRPEAPPFLVIHGSDDSLVPVEQARAFVEKLRATSLSSVAYLELPCANHAFDLTNGACTPSAVTAIGLFLDEIRQHRQFATGHAAI